MSHLIENYAMIGDGHSAALVGNDGSIDWLCLPSFSDQACCASLIGTPENGRWSIAPTANASPATRRYRPGTMILESEFTAADGGSAVVIDFMPRTDERCSRSDRHVIRIVRGKSGKIPFRCDAAPRFDYGRSTPWLRQIDPQTITAIAGPDAVVLRARGTTLRIENDAIVAHFDITAGSEVVFVMTYFASHETVPPGLETAQLEEATEQFWSGWISRYQADHPYVDAVKRSLLTLKALAYVPTGGIVAAPTTSLPEEMGGIKNWDYRYCWIRDATLTLYALFSGGYDEEADAWRKWILRAAAGKPDALQILYGIRGERRLPEFEANWLNGYRGSKPVHIGNAASVQFQLDVFGELMSAMHLARIHTGTSDDDDAWKLQRALMDYVEQHWQKPDQSLWEVRGPARDFTQSKVMAWTAVDRCIKAIEQFNLEGPLDRWRNLRDTIHRDVCDRGFNKELNAFTQYYGGKTFDAALLTLPQTGFIKATDPRFIGTVAAVEKHLLDKHGFVMRYIPNEKVVGMPGSENAFLPCSFWLATAYYTMGRHDEAKALFEKLLAVRNEVGLLSEEYDSKNKRLMGNFPQAFTHVALIATANVLAGNTGADDLLAHGGDAVHQAEA